MKYYQLVEYDQKWANYLLSYVDKERGLIVRREVFKQYECPGCHGFDRETIFHGELDSSIAIRSTSDVLVTLDNFLCVSTKWRTLIEKEPISGVEFREIPNSHWHLMNVTARVEVNPAVYTLHKPRCGICGRYREVTGLVRCLSDVSQLPRGRTFFAPIQDRGGASRARDVFATEEVVESLKKAGLKGCLFSLLLEGDDERRFKDAVSEGIIYRRRKTDTVFLK